MVNDLPTYNVDEVLEQIRNLDWPGLKMLCELLNEEKREYTLVDLDKIIKAIRFRESELEWECRNQIRQIIKWLME